ncbi:SOS response-associated peptidase family protein [Hydrogenophaga sp.]|uniref:SOS response-associated peptidase n=1 Tax=Hydrogenophaga sp. TaxID=1904254 RepID=UPI0025C095B4|nr:SOS response-associated peptidase family protein [Hydrogenophaga sp.]
MCTNYTPATPTHLVSLAEIGGLGPVVLPTDNWPVETFPGYVAPLLWRDPAGEVVCSLARYGLVPRWCRDAAQAGTVSRRTYNARSETVAEKPSYRSPWRERRWALAPMEHYFEPCWETGRAVRWRLQQPDAAPFAAAGLHEHWADPATGELVQSFSLLTVNADDHPVLRRMHRPGDEKRLLVVVPPQAFSDWLSASVDEAKALLASALPDGLMGEPAPRAVAQRSQPTDTSQASLDL